MHVLLAFFLLALPFWEAKPPAEWSVEELTGLLSDSPWAQIAEPARPAAGAPPVQVFIASAAPIRLAEAEARRRFRPRAPDPAPTRQDYQEFLQQDAGKSLVLAIRLRDPKGLSDAEEAHRMEEDCLLHIGRRRFKLTTHFPPSPGDPYLRLVFPNEVTPADRKLDFELYVPGLPSPYRQATFDLREMVFQGKPAL